MFKKTRGFRFRSLSRIGFLIPQEHTFSQSLSARVDAFFRHPLVLLLAGFMLTGVVGVIIQQQFQEGTKTRESMVRDKEGRDKTMSDWNESLSDYLLEVQRVQRDFDLVSVNQTSLKQVSIEYRDAYRQWHRKQDSVDTVILELYSKDTLARPLLMAAAADIKESTEDLDLCLSKRLESVVGKNGMYAASNTCKSKSGPDAKVRDWSEALTKCAHAVSDALRTSWTRKYGLTITYTYAFNTAPIHQACDDLPL